MVQFCWASVLNTGHQFREIQDDINKGWRVSSCIRVLGTCKAELSNWGESTLGWSYSWVNWSPVSMTLVQANECQPVPVSLGLWRFSSGYHNAYRTCANYIPEVTKSCILWCFPVSVSKDIFLHMLFPVFPIIRNVLKTGRVTTLPSYLFFHQLLLSLCM